MACVVLEFYNVHFCLGGIQDQHVCATLFGLYSNILGLPRGSIFLVSWSGTFTKRIRCEIPLACRNFPSKGTAVLVSFAEYRRSAVGPRYVVS